MRKEQDIYMDIGKILFNIAPDGAKKVIMRAELSPEDDHCEFEYDYMSNAGETTWLTAGGKANTDMLRLLVELKSLYVKKNLTNGCPGWHGCEASLDIENMKINIDFSYD